MLGRNKEKSDEEKIRERANLQDSFSVGKGELALSQQRKEQQDATRNQLLDTTEVKKQLKKSLMGVEPVQVPVQVIECQSCGSHHNQEVDKCRQCGSEDLQLTNSQTKNTVKWMETSEKQLVNQKGFDLIWSEVQGSINENITGSYLPSQTIDRVVFATCGTIIKQLSVHNDEYGVSNSEDMQQVVDIVRKNVLATANKARGGRALQSQEKTVIQKISESVKSGGDEDENNGIGLFR